MTENLQPDIVPAWDEIVRSSVESMQFGTVQIIVDNGGVVEIRSSERIRLEPGVTGSREKRKSKPPTGRQ